MSILNRIFGPDIRKKVAHEDEAIASLLEEFHQYYARFNEKLDLFSRLKELIVEIKARIYDPRLKAHRALSLSEVLELQQKVESALDELLEELRKIKKLIDIEKGIGKEERLYSTRIVSFLSRELKREAELRQKEYGIKYLELLREMNSFLLNTKNNLYGLFQILAAQLDLAQDIELARKEIEIEFGSLSKDQEKVFLRLVRIFRILELEIMRFGSYCREEADLIRPGQSLIKQFTSDYSTLRTLGLLYSERSLTKYNLGMITAKFQQNFYGVKGIGVIHEDDRIDLRFVKGKRERHAEVVQMLFEGVPGMKLADDVAIRAFLHSLPLGKITKIAGYEIQLQFNPREELRVINIDYASTILEVQIERKTMHERMLRISRQDFERLNYTLLFSINKDLLNKSMFQLHIEQRGNKINVTDTRIYPFVE